MRTLDRIIELPTEMILKLMNHVVNSKLSLLESFSNVCNFSRTNKRHFDLFNSEQFKRNWKNMLINKTLANYNITYSKDKIVIENEIIHTNIKASRMPTGYCETEWKKENMINIAKKYPNEITKVELEKIIKEQLNFNDEQLNHCFEEYNSREKYKYRWVFSDYTMKHHSQYNDPNNFHKDIELFLFFKGNNPYNCDVYDDNIDNIDKSMELLATIIIFFIENLQSNYHFSAYLPVGRYTDVQHVDRLMRIYECEHYNLEFINFFELLESSYDKEDITEHSIISKYKSHWMHLLKWYYQTI